MIDVMNSSQQVMDLEDAILRHNGVDVGKKDYLGPMPFKPAPQ